MQGVQLHVRKRLNPRYVLNPNNGDLNHNNITPLFRLSCTKSHARGVLEFASAEAVELSVSVILDKHHVLSWPRFSGMPPSRCPQTTITRGSRRIQFVLYKPATLLQQQAMARSRLMININGHASLFPIIILFDPSLELRLCRTKSGSYSC